MSGAIRKLTKADMDKLFPKWLSDKLADVSNHDPDCECDACWALQDAFVLREILTPPKKESE